MTDNTGRDAYFQRIVDNVGEHGCHIVSVFDPKGEQPDFAYSVGFPETLEQPDVVVSGLPRNLTKSMINEVYDQCSKGLKLADWLAVDGLLEGFSCILRAVSSEWLDSEYFASANWYERRRTGDGIRAAYQIVWPGARHGLFPWQDGADLDEVQPSLYSVGALS